jgi:hypothetical protein
MFTDRVLEFLNHGSIVDAIAHGNVVAMAKIQFATECLKVLVEHGKIVDAREDMVAVLLKAQHQLLSSDVVVTGHASVKATSSKLRASMEQVLDRVKVDMGDASFIDLVSTTTQKIEGKREERRNKRKFARVAVGTVAGVHGDEDDFFEDDDGMVMEREENDDDLVKQVVMNTKKVRRC